MSDKQSAGLLTMRVDALAHGGEFVGQILEGSPGLRGKKVFVRGVAPGEIVEVSLLSEEKNLVRARCESVVKPSSERISPRCPKFGVCGGCDLQHLTLDAQREAKRSMVESMLEKHASLKPRRGVGLAGSGLAGFNYRRRVTLHLNLAGELGFFKHETNEVVAIDYCYLAEAVLNRAIRELKPVLAPYALYIGSVSLEEHSGRVFVGLRIRETPGGESVIFPRQMLSVLAKQIPSLTLYKRAKPILAQVDFRQNSANGANPPVGHFTQVNKEANELLRQLVLERVDSPRVTDLYAGAGNFSLPLAAAGKQVEAVEVDPALVAYGRFLARSMGQDELLRFYQMSCRRFLKHNRPAETVILDPPRSGAREVIELLNSKDCKRIIYISCNLPSLVRELKDLAGRGFELDEVLLVDMFPQTYHVETVAVLHSPCVFY